MPSKSFTLTLWTNDPRVARNADRAGVDRIGLDLETLGKETRQGGLSTWISQHDISDLPAIRDALSEGSLFVRCNPLNPGSSDEVSRLIDLGVAVIMLPNFEDIDDVERFLSIVDGRARVVPLVERLKAARAVHRFARIPEIQEIHVGLNDLSIDLGLKHRMAVLLTDLLADAVRIAAEIGIRLAIGGVARAFDQTVPIPSDLVYAQYARLHSAGGFIAQSFHAETLNEAEFASEIDRVRTRMTFWRGAPPSELQAAREALARILAEPQGLHA